MPAKFNLAHIDPEEIPTAEVIARVIIAVAAVTGDNPLEVFDTPPRRRCVAPAFNAVRAFYPLYPASRLGIPFGLTDNPIPRINSALKAGWWQSVGAPAQNAGMAWLEGH